MQMSGPDSSKDSHTLILSVHKYLQMYITNVQDTPPLHVAW